MSKEEELTELAIKVSQSSAIDLFCEFLEKFKEVEAEHIQLLIEKSDVRAASLCAEAYATIELVLKKLEGDLNDL